MNDYAQRRKGNGRAQVQQRMWFRTGTVIALRKGLPTLDATACCYSQLIFHVFAHVLVPDIGESFQMMRIWLLRTARDAAAATGFRSPLVDTSTRSSLPLYLSPHLSRGSATARRAEQPHSRLALAPPSFFSSGNLPL